MAEQRHRVSNGRQTLLLTSTELAQYVSGLSRRGQDELTLLSGPVDSMYTNEYGQLAQERLSLDQIIQRIRVGQQPILLGPSDPRRDMKRRQDQSKIQREIDEGANLAAARQGWDPWRMTGLPQAAENYLVGADVAREGRQRLSDANSVVTSTGLIGQGLLLSGGIGVAARAAGLTAAKGSAKALAGKLAADEIGINTAFAVNDALNNNKPLVAEDLGRSILGGLVITSPIIGTALVRRPIAAAVKGSVPTVSKGLSKLADTGVVAGIAAKQKHFFKVASGLRVGQRFLERGKAKGIVRGSGIVDESLDLQKLVKDDAVAIGKLKPGISERDALKILDAVGNYIDDYKQLARLERVEWNLVRPGVQGIRSSVVKVRTLTNATTKKVRRSVNPKNAPKLSREGQLEWAARTDEIVDKLDSIGYGTLVEKLEPLRGKSKTYMGTYNNWVEARLDAGLAAAAGRGGASEAAALLDDFIKNPVVWSDDLVKRGTEVNKAINTMSNAFRKLDDLTLNLADNYDISAPGTRMQDIRKAIADVEEAYKVLARERVIAKSALQDLDVVMRDVHGKMKLGDKAFNDHVVINKAYKAAVRRHSEFDDQVFRKTMGDVYADRQASQIAIAERTERWQANLRKLISGADIASRGVTFGILALWNYSEMERSMLFEEVTGAINSYTGSPFALEEAMGDYLAPFDQEDPELAGMAGVSTGNAIFWLQSQTPRTDRSIYGSGVSKAKRDEYLEKFVAAIDPMSVPEAALLGRATKGAVDSLRVTNPELYAQIGIVASEVLAESDLASMPRSVQNGLNQLLGGIDPLYTGPALLELQSNYAQTPAQQQVTGGAGGMPDGSNPQKPGNQFTFTQRLSSY